MGLVPKLLTENSLAIDSRLIRKRFNRDAIAATQFSHYGTYYLINVVMMVDLGWGLSSVSGEVSSWRRFTDAKFVPCRGFGRARANSELGLVQGLWRVLEPRMLLRDEIVNFNPVLCHQFQPQRVSKYHHSKARLLFYRLY